MTHRIRTDRPSEAVWYRPRDGDRPISLCGHHRPGKGQGVTMATMDVAACDESTGMPGRGSGSGCQNVGPEFNSGTAYHCPTINLSHYRTSRGGEPGFSMKEIRAPGARIVSGGEGDPGRNRKRSASLMSGFMMVFGRTPCRDALQVSLEVKRIIRRRLREKCLGSDTWRWGSLPYARSAGD